MRGWVRCQLRGWVRCQLPSAVPPAVRCVRVTHRCSWLLLLASLHSQASPASASLRAPGTLWSRIPTSDLLAGISPQGSPSASRTSHAPLPESPGQVSLVTRPYFLCISIESIEITPHKTTAVTRVTRYMIHVCYTSHDRKDHKEATMALNSRRPGTLLRGYTRRCPSKGRPPGPGCRCGPSRGTGPTV